jgi:hypothetical protein
MDDTNSTGSVCARTRRGKIARLPKEIRERLNRALEDGKEGKELLEWLNGLPEGQAVLAAEFGGAPISANNLSNWTGGLTPGRL